MTSTSAKGRQKAPKVAAAPVEDEAEMPLALLDQPVLIEGKRKRKTIDQFKMEVPVIKKRKVVAGSGLKLKDIPSIQRSLQHKFKNDELIPLHRLCFDGSRKSIVKKELGEFQGFGFNKDSDNGIRKQKKLLKFTKDALIGQICAPLCLATAGSKEVIADKILEFLLCPSNLGQVREDVKVDAKKPATVVDTKKPATAVKPKPKRVVAKKPSKKAAAKSDPAAADLDKEEELSAEGSKEEQQMEEDDREEAADDGKEDVKVDAKKPAAVKPKPKRVAKKSSKKAAAKSDPDKEELSAEGSKEEQQMEEDDKEAADDGKQVSSNEAKPTDTS